LIFDFIQQLDELNSVEAIRASFAELIGRFGFTYFLIGRITPNVALGDRGQVWAVDSPNDWFRFWMKNHFPTDPIVERTRQQQLPFRWSDMRAFAEAKGSRVLDEARCFGLSDGLSSSMRLGNGAVAAVTLGTPRYDLSAKDEALLHLASVYCETKLSHLMHRPASDVVLSERERECLIWVASGKTDWDISEILGISQQTVHKHVSNALRKLNAGTRAQAVAIALMAKQISF
jgi:LuxR family quorum sensing-dependent transcriptional regulator